MVGFLVAVFGAVLVWLLVAPSRAPRPPSSSAHSAELEAAEREVRDLGTLTTPEDADDELPDWGPGAPKP